MCGFVFYLACLTYPSLCLAKIFALFKFLFLELPFFAPSIDGTVQYLLVTFLFQQLAQFLFVWSILINASDQRFEP